MKINFAIALFLLLYSFDGISQIISLSSDKICDEECIVKIENISYYEYTGGDYNNKNVREQKIKIASGKKQWVKKKQDAKCLSPNPDDCLVWCLEETATEYFKFYTVIDTNAIKDFKLKSYRRSNINSDDTLQILPVICKDEIPHQMLTLVTNVLIKAEFLKEDEIYRKYNGRIRKALKCYQEYYDLPVGHLNLKTLDHMKIKYKID